MVTMVALDGAPSACQYLAPSSSGVDVVVVWLSDEVAVTAPGRSDGRMLMV
jgi:hypothetical protein